MLVDAVELPFLKKNDGHPYRVDQNLYEKDQLPNLLSISK
jgi:hypothetical protein